MKTSILIPDGESTLAKFVIQCLSLDNEVEIHILSKDPNASIKHSRFITSFQVYDPEVIGVVKPRQAEESTDELDELTLFHYYDSSRSVELLKVIIGYAKETNAHILFPVDEHIVKVLSLHKEEITQAGLLILMPDHQIFMTAIDKWKLSVFLKSNSIPHPNTFKYQKDVKHGAAINIQFPVIIKPIDQGNALGIQSFEKAEDMWSFFEGQKLKHEYVIQPIIEGYDIDCSVLCYEGRIINYTIQKGIVSPKVKYRAAVGIEFLYEAEVIQVVEKMMKLLNWSGVAHIDLRYDQINKEVKVIEINARYWGSMLGSLNAGINFAVLAYRTMKGEKVEQTKYSFKRYFMGKAPIKKILTTLFNSGIERVRLKDTSLYYSMRDPKPVFYEMLSKIKNRF